VLGICIAALPMLIYHWAAFGNPFTTGYKYKVSYQDVVSSTSGMFSTRFWAGLYGNLIGSNDPANRNVGILARFPVLIFGIVGLIVGWRGAGKRLALAFTAGVAVWTLFFSKYAVYSGGASGDSRFMTPVAVFLALAVGWLIDTAQRMESPWGVILIGGVEGVAGVSALNAITDLANHFGHNWRMDRVDHVMMNGWPHLLVGSGTSWSYLFKNAFPNGGNILWIVPIVCAVLVVDFVLWKRSQSREVAPDIH
jgi:hypothetical protein